MKETHREKPMSLGDLTIYLEDLIRMGFVTEHVGKDGQLYYRLTELGKKTGMESLSNSR